MKILLISHLIPYPPTGGSPLRNYNLLKEMSARHEIYMLTFHQRAHLQHGPSLDDRTKAIARFCKHLEVFDIPTDFSKMRWYLLLLTNLFSLTPYSVWRYWSREMAEAIKKQVSEHDFDVVHFDTIALADFARFTSTLAGVLNYHNIESQLLYRRSAYVTNPLAKLYLLFQSWKLKRFERRAGSLIDIHVTVSEKDKRTLAAICPDARIAVVPNGVDPEFFTATDDAVEPNSLVYVGGMTWFPNLDAMKFFLGDIWPLIKKDMPDATMKHVGMRTAADLHKLPVADESVRFLGFVNDVRPAVINAAVYVVPLRIGGGTRLKILDAMAMGKAIVSTSIGCEGINVTDGHDIAIADTPEDFAQKVIELLRNPALRERLGKNARRSVVEKYSWKKIAPQLESIYAEAGAAASKQASVAKSDHGN